MMLGDLKHRLYIGIKSFKMFYMKNLFHFVAVTLVLFLFAFTPTPRLKSRPPKKISIGVSLNPVLYPLYIDNSTKNSQLDSLINVQRKGCFLNHYKKIIFQYFYKDDPTGFTLTAYIGTRKQKKFEQKVIQFSSFTTLCDTPYKQIDKNVFLGDFEFVDQKAAIKSLDSLSSDNIANKYIVFYPSLEQVVMNGISRVNINYKLYAVSALSEICNIKPDAKGPIGALTVKPAGPSTNPSPPYGGN